MKITSPEHLAIYLKDVRKGQEQSQTALAQRVGLRQDTVSKFENSPAKTQIETLFRVLSAMELELHVQPKGTDEQAAKWGEEW